MADQTDRQAQLEAQLARMQATMRALNAGDSPEVRVDKTIATLAKIDRYTGKGDSRKPGADGHISGEEMAIYAVEQYEARGGSRKQILADIAAIEYYPKVNAAWTAQKDDKGPVTPKMVMEALQADAQARQRLSALINDESDLLKHDLGLIRADQHKLQSTPAATITVAEQRKPEAPLKPEQFASAAAGLANAKDEQAYKDSVGQLMRGMAAADPRVRSEQDKRIEQIGKRFDEIGDKLDAKAAAVAAQLPAKQAELQARAQQHLTDKLPGVMAAAQDKQAAAVQKMAERMRAAGQTDAADRLLAEYAQRKPDVAAQSAQAIQDVARHVAAQPKPQTGAEMQGVVREEFAAQKEEMMKNARVAMGREAPTREVADPNAAMKAALMGEKFAKALKYEGHIDPISLGDLKNAVSQGKAAAPAKEGRQ